MPGPKMRIVFVSAVLLVAVSSVLFGLDWTSAPMQPMPETKNLVFVAPPPPPPPQPVAAPVEAAPSVQPVVAVAPPPVAPPPPAPAPQVAAPPLPKCDISACTRAYHSFTESDCTYQPSDGPRRLCTKGVVPKEAGGAAAPADAQAQSNAPPDAQAGAQPTGTCNVNACAAAYGSFTASDCTYQPFNGPRRTCEK
jgi:hypothetical protein